MQRITQKKSCYIKTSATTSLRDNPFFTLMSKNLGRLIDMMVDSGIGTFYVDLNDGLGMAAHRHLLDIKYHKPSLAYGGHLVIGDQQAETLFRCICTDSNCRSSLKCPLTEEEILQTITHALCIDVGNFDAPNDVCTPIVMTGAYLSMLGDKEFQKIERHIQATCE